MDVPTLSDTINTDEVAEILAAEAADAYPDLVWFPAVAHQRIPCAVTNVSGLLCSYAKSGVSDSKVISEVPADLKEHIVCL